MRLDYLTPMKTTSKPQISAVNLAEVRGNKNIL